MLACYNIDEGTCWVSQLQASVLLAPFGSFLGGKAFPFREGERAGPAIQVLGIREEFPTWTSSA